MATNMQARPHLPADYVPNTPEMVEKVRQAYIRVNHKTTAKQRARAIRQAVGAQERTAAQLRTIERLERRKDTLQQKQERKKQRVKKRKKGKQPNPAAIARLRSLPYDEYLKTRHWKDFRKLALDHHGSKCNRCESVSRLQVHHKTYANLGNEQLGDVEILCKSCHRAEHGLPE